MNEATELRTQAWLLQGEHSLPGMLQLQAGRLSFTAAGLGTFSRGRLRKLSARAQNNDMPSLLEAGRDAVLFDTPLANVLDIRFPWYYFSGGVKLSVDGVGYRFGFDRPANTTIPDAMHNMAEGARGRESGKAWKSALTQA